MATKTLYNSPTVNPFSFLPQEDGQGGDANAAQRGVKKDDGPAVLTPAQKAERRAQANAEKQKENEAARQKAQQDAALAALVGPLDDFQTQKGPKKSKDERNDKKLKREEFEKAEHKPYHHDGDRPPRNRDDGYQKKQYDGPRKDRAPGDKKPYNNRGDGSGNFEKKLADGTHKKREQNSGASHQSHQGQGNRPPRREFDKHSAGKTPNRPEEKRHGEGSANWGSPLDSVAATGDVWTDSTPSAPAEAGWGDENEPKTAPVHEEDKKSGADADATPKEKKDLGPAWDDEGYGKMSLAEFNEKVAAQRKAELEKKVGTVQPRSRELDGVDMTKFVEKDSFGDDKFPKKADKKDKKKPVAAARPGEKAVNLAEVFAVGRPGRGGGGERPRGRGGRGAGGDRPPRDNADRPPRDNADRPPRDNADRPPRDNADRPPRDDNKPRGTGNGRGNQQNRGDYNPQAHKLPTSNKAFPELSAAVNK